MPKKKTSKKPQLSNYQLDGLRACIGLVESIQSSEDAKEKLKFIWELRIQEVVDSLNIKVRKNSVSNCLEDLYKALHKYKTSYNLPTFKNDVVD